MSKIVLTEKDAKNKLLNGVRTLTDAVKITLGPKGRNVVLDVGTEPLITNDGVTIAKHITFEDKAENLGANVIKNACIKTNDVAGDGTTTATLLTYSLFSEGLKYTEMGANPIFLRVGINKAIDFVVNEMKKHVFIVEDYNAIKQVATISSASNLVGELIAEGYKKVGFNGTIVAEDGVGTNSSLEVVEGVRLPHGFLSPYMCVNGGSVAECDNPYILVTDKRITNANEVLPIMEQVAKVNGSLVIIADDVDGDALNTIVINDVRKSFNCLCVKAPFYAERKADALKDLALILNANLISSSVYNSLTNLTLQDLGRCKKIRADKSTTTILGASYDKQKVTEKIEELKTKKAQTVGYEKECLEQRINMLTGAVAIIKVGANSEIELKENKLRIEDAINATSSAIEEGVIAGGGTAFVKVKMALEEFANTLVGDEKLGAIVVKNTLGCVLKQIAKNAGVDEEKVLKIVAENPDFNYGYNALNNTFCNMVESGIIDPFKVTRTALITAGSVAATLLTTECVVVDKG